jgi:ammonium transporter, Amt family
MKPISYVFAAFCLLFPFSSAFAADGLNTGDTAWMIVATALVMVMTPAGLALFYGGMSRSKNLLNTLCNDLCGLLSCQRDMDDVGLYPCIRA